MSAPRETNHEALRENLAAYALGALPPGELDAVEAHLDECAACRAELRWLGPAVDVLPASVEQRRPPERLKRALMAEVERDAATTPATQPESQADRRPSFAQRVLVPLARRPAIALGAVILVLAGVATALIATQGAEQAPGTSTTTLEARNLGGNGEFGATLAVSDPAEGGTLRVDEIAPVDRGHVYQLWVQRNGGVEPSSIFVPREDGSAEAAVTQSLEGADAVLMTEEPRGGSEQPTTAAFASVPIGT
ncbi:anti-sigma factor [Thermoleophilia bacterium SCSIO 60948]|nr:anti-sigma factor [Thermoleophilia bacterium SCSIO 60948]